MTDHGGVTGREYIEREVLERLVHGSVEDVRVTCSFARAERLLGREYHGRFLIELLQNAADAWRADVRSAAARSRVAVVLAEGPALVVANEGAPMSAEVVIESLGHIGASTKPEGEAIGHKGIGFKSVLEISLTPEIYSGLAQAEPTLAVRFDPTAALGAAVDPVGGRSVTTALVGTSSFPTSCAPRRATRSQRFPCSVIPDGLSRRRPRWSDSRPKGLTRSSVSPSTARTQPDSASTNPSGWATCDVRSQR